MRKSSLLVIGWLVLAGALAFGLSAIEVDDFSGGLNLADNWSLVKPNQAQTVLNWTLDDPVGGLKVRPGFVPVYTDTGYTFLFTNVAGFKFDDGVPYLFSEAFRFDSGRVDLMVSNGTDYEARQRIYRGISRISGEGIFSRFESSIIYSSAYDPTLVIQRTRGPHQVAGQTTSAWNVFELALPGPGQLAPRNIGVNEGGASTQVGYYQYTVVARVPCSTSVWARRFSTLSRPVLVDSNKVRLSNFSRQPEDSFCVPPATMDFMVLRTKGNALNYATDSLWRVGIALAVPLAAVDTFTFLDGMADVALTDTNFFGPIKDPAVQIWNPFRRGVYSFYTTPAQGANQPWDYRWAWIRRDSTSPDVVALTCGRRKNYAWAPGSPTIITENIATLKGDSTVLGQSIVGDTVDVPSGFNPGPNSTIFQVYHVVFYDTKTGRKSDTGAGLVVGLDADYWRQARKLGLPPTPSSNIARIILRTDWDGHIAANGAPTPFGMNSVNTTHLSEYVRFVLDTIRDSSVTYYIDHTNHLELVSDTGYGPWERSLPPEINFHGTISHEGTLWAWDDRSLYWSSDSTTGWALFNEITFDEEDGSSIVAVASANGYLVIYKNTGVWLLYTQDGQPGSTRQKVISGIGLVSSRALTYWRGNAVILTREAVLMQADNPNKDYSLGFTPISDAIRPLIVDRPLTGLHGLSTAILIAHKDRLYLSFPGTDSTLVYHFQTGGWAIWDFDFARMISFDVNKTEGIGFDKITCVAAVGTNLYQLTDSIYTDAGTAYTAKWEKRYLGLSSDQSAIPELHLWSEATCADTVKAYISLADERNTLIDSLTVDSLGQIFQRLNLRSGSAQVGHGFRLRINALNREGVKINQVTLVPVPAGRD